MACTSSTDKAPSALTANIPILATFLDYFSSAIQLPCQSLYHDMCWLHSTVIGITGHMQIFFERLYCVLHRFILLRARCACISCDAPFQAVINPFKSKKYHINIDLGWGIGAVFRLHLKALLFFFTLQSSTSSWRMFFMM